LGSFCSTIELHPRWVRIIPGYGWLFLTLEIAGHVTGKLILGIVKEMILGLSLITMVDDG